MRVGTTGKPWSLVGSRQPHAVYSCRTWLAWRPDVPAARQHDLLLTRLVPARRRGSSVGIVSRLRFGSPRYWSSNPGRDDGQPSTPSSKHTQPLIQWVGLHLSSRGKSEGREADHERPYGADTVHRATRFGPPYVIMTGASLVTKRLRDSSERPVPNICSLFRIDTNRRAEQFSSQIGGVSLNKLRVSSRT